MNTTTFRLALLAAVAVTPALAGTAATPNAWSNPTGAIPTQSTIVGGPWTLGAPAAVLNGTTQTYSDAPGRNVVSLPSAPTDYCVANSSGVLLENLNANPTATVMAPFYFPNVVGEGKNLFGYFNYRPSSLNEITVAAKSADAGKTWTWLGDALQADPSNICPASNTPAGNDTLLGHPYVADFGGAYFLYLLDRRGGHIDADGLVVKRLKPTVSNPLNANPQLNATALTTPPANNTGVIAGWNFENYDQGAQPVNNPAPDIGTAAGSAQTLGMTNNYTCFLNGTTTVDSGSVADDDIIADAGSSDSSSSTWRVRGPSTTNTPVVAGDDQCNGWSILAPQYTQGAQFMVDTTGVANVLLQYDWFTTKQGVRNLQVRYTLDGGNTWTNFGSLQTATANGFNNAVQIDFSTVPAAGNNPLFGVQLVSAYDPTLAPGSTTVAKSAVAVSWGTTGATFPGEYSSATLTGGKPVLYNNNSGNWRFANVKFFDKTKIVTTGPTATDFSVKTTGLLNPDGILAVIPNTSPRKVLYVQKQLGAVSTTSPSACAAPVAGTQGNINYDLDTIRLAQTTDGIHFTDLGATTGLTNPTDTTTTGLRFAAPNGSIVKFANGKLGLFFGTGNCQDGDSDGFHLIAYAENTDSTYLNWTVVNGYNNPIANVSFGQAPSIAPLTGTSSQNTVDPVSGLLTQNYSFGGRTYNPNAIYQDANHISLIFAGYNFGYFQGDLASYRTINQITLTSSNPLVP